MKLKAITYFALNHLGTVVDKGTQLILKRQENMALEHAERLEAVRQEKAGSLILLNMDELTLWDNLIAPEEVGANLALALVDRHPDELERITIDCSMVPTRFLTEELFHSFLDQVARSLPGEVSAAKRIHWKPKFMVQRAKINLWIGSYTRK